MQIKSCIGLRNVATPDAGATTHHTPEVFKSPYSLQTTRITHISHHQNISNAISHHNSIDGNRPYGEASETVAHHTSEYGIARTITKPARVPTNEIIMNGTNGVVQKPYAYQK